MHVSEFKYSYKWIMYVFITIILKLDIDIYHTLYTKYSINRGFCEISKKRDVTLFRKGLWQTAFAIFKPLVEFGEVVQ